MMAVTQPDCPSMARTYTATAFSHLYPGRSDPKRDGSRILIRRNAVAMRLPAASYDGILTLEKKKARSSICTADELHHVAVANSDWRLALWRYLPCSLAPPRNHPLLLLSGVGTNAVGYDLSPEDHFSMRLEDFQKQLDEIGKYDWDFDHYLEEDLPAALEYIRTQCRPKDGKLLAIGHSMGGILLYAMLARCNSIGINSELASVATLGSSLDYSSSKSSLRLLLPLTDPARALKVPVIPLGALLAAVHPLVSLPPYLFSWLKLQITAKDMMAPDLLEKLVMNNFGTVPAKLLLQLSTAFNEGGLCDRSGLFCYKDHLHKTKVPVLALAGDHDLICPPEAVYETVKLIPKQLATYQVLGKPNGPHYAHYDLVGGLLAAEQVYPLIVEFLNRHDVA